MRAIKGPSLGAAMVPEVPVLARGVRPVPVKARGPRAAVDLSHRLRPSTKADRAQVRARTRADRRPWFEKVRARPPGAGSARAGPTD